MQSISGIINMNPPTTNNMKSGFIFFVSWMLIINAWGQKNFQAGMIKKNDGSIVNGWIDYRQWERNPKKIKFSEAKDGTAVEYTTNDLLSFEISGKETYEKAIVTKDMRPVDVDKLVTTENNIDVTDTVFLRELVKGDELSLYILNDSKEHFYIKEPNSNYEELVYKVYLRRSSSGTGIDKRYIFRDQLKKNIFSKSNFKQLELMLENMSYEEVVLTKFVKKINNQSVSGNAEKERPAFFVSAGLQTSSLSITGKHTVGGMKFSNSLSPVFGAGVDFFSKRGLKAFVLRLELLYSSLDYKGDGTMTNTFGHTINHSYRLKITNITPTFSIFYSFVRSPSFRLYTGIGMGYNFSSYPINQYIETNTQINVTQKHDDYLEFEENWMSGNLQLGGIIKNKFEVIASIKAFGGFERFIGIQFQFAPLSLRAAYRF